MKTIMKHAWMLYVVFAGFLLLAFTLYYPALSVGFLSDDFDFLYHTANQPSLLSHFATTIIGTRGDHSYGPMFNVVFSLEYWMFGMKAIGYHLVSLLAHTVVAFVIFLLTRRWTKNDVVALAAGLVFLFLPSHTEAVVWVAAQTHLLASLWYVLALYAYDRFVREENSIWYAVAMVGVIFSLLTKEIALPFLVVFALMDLAFHPRHETVRSTLWRLTRRIAIPVLVLVAYLFIRRAVAGYLFGYYANPHVALDLVGMGEMALELTMSMVIGSPLRQQLTETLYWYAPFLVMGTGLLLVTLLFVGEGSRRVRLLLVGVYGATLLPYLFLRFNPDNNEGERYGYLPSVFFVMLVAVFVWWLCRVFRQFRVYIFLGMTTILLVVMWSIQLPKLQSWTRATVVAHRILESYAPLLAGHNDFLLFVGLPDNVDGAQVFRNAIKEAVALTYNIPLPTGDRLPWYLILRHDDTLPTVYARRREALTYDFVTGHATSTEAFVGIPVRNGKSLVAYAFQNPGDNWSVLHLRVNTPEVEKLKAQKKRVRIIYVSQGRLQSVVAE